MKDLFSNDKALKPRDQKGRYATPLKAYADRAKHDAEYWRFEAMKYYRMYQAVTKRLIYLERLFDKLKGN